MKIAYFTDTFYPEINGVANTLKNLSNYLYSKNIDNIFFAPDYDNKFQNKINSKTFRFKSIKASLYPECRLSFPLYTFHKEKIEAFSPDIIHITTPLGIGHLGLKYSKKYKIPVVMSYHTNFDAYLKFYDIEYLNDIVWGYLKWFYSKADLTLCPSKNTMDSLMQKDFENLDIFTRGVDDKKFNPQFKNNEIRNMLGGKDKLLFLYVGRIAAEKNLDTLVQSIKIVNKKYKDKVNFVFTGDGPYIDLIKPNNIENCILTGAKKNKELSEIYSSCDAFVFPSGSETFGNVLLEAMASGLPSVCVNSGGVLDFAKDNINSIICDYKCSESFANGIIKLIENPQLRKKLSLGALYTANEKSWDTVFASLINNYRDVINSH